MQNHPLYITGLIFILPCAVLLKDYFKPSSDRRIDNVLTVAIMALVTVLSFCLFWQISSLHSPAIIDFDLLWLPLNMDKYLDAGIFIDDLSSTLLLLLTATSFLTHLLNTNIQSIHSQRKQPHSSLSLLTCTICTIALLLTNNLLYLFIFWELLALGIYMCRVVTVHEDKKVVISNTYAHNFSPFPIALICKVLTRLYILCERLVLSPLKGSIREPLPSNALIIDNNVLCARMREGLRRVTAQTNNNITNPTTNDYRFGISKLIITKYFASTLNIIGDLSFVIAIIICYTNIGSLEYIDIIAAVESHTLTDSVKILVSTSLLFSVLIRSAQFLLYVWGCRNSLTQFPSQIMLHSCYIGLACTYVIARMFPIFDDSVLMLLAYIGAIISVMGALFACRQITINNILICSTISEQGLILLILGIGGYSSGLFCLCVHTICKAGLLCSSYAIAHATQSNDKCITQTPVRLISKMPLTAICSLICTLSLLGFPFSNGHWSKSLGFANLLYILKITPQHLMLLACFCAIIILSSISLSRLWYYTFVNQLTNLNVSPTPILTLVPMIFFTAIILVTNNIYGSTINNSEIIEYTGNKTIWNTIAQRSGFEKIKQYADHGYVSSHVDYGLVIHAFEYNKQDPEVAMHQNEQNLKLITRINIVSHNLYAMLSLSGIVITLLYVTCIGKHKYNLIRHAKYPKAIL